MGLFGNTLDASNHESPVGAVGGRIQKWTDPLAWLPGGLGDKWVDLTSHKIPKVTNEILSPVAQLGGKVDQTINPLRRIPIVNNVMNTVEAKPADAIGTAVGAYFAAPVLAGAAGAAGGGGAAAGGGAAGGGAAGAAGGGSLAGLGTGTFDTTAAYASPLAEGLGTGTAGTGMGASGTATGTLGSFPAASGGMLNPMQAQVLSRALSNMGQSNGGQSAPVQLGAANAPDPQASIVAGPTAPAINPAMRQQLSAQLMRGY
jgi:hypothetical protein